MTSTAHSPALTDAAVNSPKWLDVVREHVAHLRYGAVQLVVHDGRVTLVECTEKVRLPSVGLPVR